MTQIQWKQLISMLFLLMLFAGGSKATTLYWIESNFSGPKLISADASGTPKGALLLAPQSLPQGVAASATAGRIFVAELAFVNAHVKYVGTSMADSGALISLQSSLRGIAVDSTDNKLYWTSTNLVNGPGIYRANVNGSSAEVLQAFGAGSSHVPFGIAVNEPAQTMYWADFDAGAIVRAQASPASVPQAIITGLSGPVGVALDADSGAVFWTDANAGVIGRANLDGSGAKTIVSGCATPQYLCVDRAAGIIYWTEFSSLRVRSANLDGSDTATVAVTANPPVGITAVSEPTVIVRRPVESIAHHAYAVSANFSGPGFRAIRVRYQIPHGSSVALKIFDGHGRQVAELTEPFLEAGNYTRIVATNGLASGLYYVRFVAGTFESTTTVPVLQ
jgi:hypothetical protein